MLRGKKKPQPVTTTMNITLRCNIDSEWFTGSRGVPAGTHLLRVATITLDGNGGAVVKGQVVYTSEED